MLIKRVIKTSISQWGYGLPNNPMDSVVMPSPHKPRSRRVSEEELELLLQYAKSNRNIFIAPIIEFAIETGMRRSEILKLKWENIDNGIASLYDTKNGEDRYIPLTRHAQGVLKMLSKVSHYVFPITADCLKSAWNRIKQRSNIKDLRFHDLRHESVSRFFEMGLSIPEVALISGHKDVRQLFRYTHLKAENLREKYKEVF
jgi:integrase